MRRAIVLVAVALMSAVAARAVASTPQAAPKSTLAGIYTTSQATRGEDIYYNLCVTCHPAGTYTGRSFKSNWEGRPLSDLYDWVKTKMPKSAPGTLTQKESLQVIAYILRLNKMPPGKAELAANRAALAQIRIELK